LVLEFATRLAVRRANQADIERLRDITELLIPAFERGDQVVIGHGFQRWLDALIDAGHSIAIRWIANPFLEAYRDVLDRFPALWVLEPSFPQHLRDFIVALDAAEEEKAVEVTRTYYKRVDAAFAKAMEGALGARGGHGRSAAGEESAAEVRKRRRSERP
jgi:DNA-binding GntR family transcriptional regulator